MALSLSAMFSGCGSNTDTSEKITSNVQDTQKEDKKDTSQEKTEQAVSYTHLADSYTENVENQIRKADEKLKKSQRNNSGTNLSLKMSVLWRNCKCRKETFYGTQWNLQGVP